MATFGDVEATIRAQAARTITHPMLRASETDMMHVDEHIVYGSRLARNAAWLRMWRAQQRSFQHKQTRWDAYHAACSVTPHAYWEGRVAACYRARRTTRAWRATNTTVKHLAD